VRTVLWAAWVITAFTATHIPPPEHTVPPLISDKLLHFAGFTTLGLLTIWRISAGGVQIRSKVAWLWYLGLVAYGLFDETTQPLVRRSFQWGDWIADCGGAAAGVAIALLCHRWTLNKEG